MLEGLGKFVFRYRWQTLLAAGFFLAGALTVLVRGGDLTTGTIQGIESYRAQQLVQDVLGHPSETMFIALFHNEDLEPTGEVFQRAMQQALEPLEKDPRVLSVVTPTNAPSFLKDSMVNPKAHLAYALVTVAGDLKRAVQAYPAVRKELQSTRLTVTCTGQLPFTSDLDRTLEHDLLHAEAISLPLALLVLLAVFGTAVAATLPAGVGGLSVVGGIAVVLLLSRRLDIAQYTINVCSLIGSGVAIDYSLFIVSRYREELDAGHSYEDALVRAIKTAGRVVLFSGFAVGIGLCGLLFFENSYLQSIGLSGAVVVCLAVLFALTFLPALLAVLGPRIHAGTVPVPNWGFTKGAWHRMATWVMRRPVVVLVPTLSFLILLGVPFQHVRLATADVRVLDDTVEARRGYNEFKKWFPTQAATRVLIAIQFPALPVPPPEHSGVLTAERVGAIFDFSRNIAKVPHILKVESIADSGDPTITRETYQEVMIHPPDEVKGLVDAAKRQIVGEHVVLMYALSDLPSDSDEARDLIRTLRKNRHVGDGTFLIGGQTAQDLDTTDYIVQRLPRALGFVVGCTLVILFFLLGSVVLPIKAVAMNFLSITGSFGAIVYIFQDGHLWITEPLPLEPSLPVMLFCALFGLSMDYEVLMLSRIKESYEHSGDNTAAVAEGLEKTAGLITSAAAIMVVVFSAFSLAKVVDIQAVGFGMAIAVAMDATLVRILIVPATMRLFGDLNWWAPKWMMAMRERLGIFVRRK
jgi:RND superfamily putative drug exporter